MFCCTVFSQPKTIDEIDRVLEKSKEEFVAYNFYESIKYGKEALEASRKIDYSKGIALSSIYKAKVLIELGDYKKGLVFLNDAEKEPFYLKYLNMQVEIFRLKGRIYGNLEMYNLALEQFREQLNNSFRIKDENQKKNSLLWSYQNITHVFRKLNANDSVNKYLKLQERIVITFDEKKNFYSVSSTYTQIAKQNIELGDLEKAKFYLDKSERLLLSNKANYLFDLFETKAIYEEAIGNIDIAEEYYIKALKNTDELKDKDAESYLKEAFSIFLKKHKSKSKKSNLYYLEHLKLKDSLEKVNNNILDNVYLDVIKKIELKEKKKTLFNEGVLLFFVLLSMLIVCVLWTRKIYYKNEIKEKIVELDIRDEELNTAINNLNNSKFDELMELANKNSPEFLVSFREYYPEVIENIKNYNPKATSFEIGFCALAFLNFSTKEIAEIQNVTIRAIQVRKNRIRKKFNIPSDYDFNIWMNDHLY